MRSVDRWWLAIPAGLVIIAIGIVGLIALRTGGDDLSSGTEGGGTSASDASESGVAGRWVLESWDDNGTSVTVEAGVNTTSVPWIEFIETFEGARDTFVSADERGTAGTFLGSTGCNDIADGTEYEYAAGFLMVGEVVVSAVGCDPDAAEEVLLAMLWNTPDGIEVIHRGDTMEWYASNLHGATAPLTFRRDGAPPSTTIPAAAPTEEPSFLIDEVDGVEVVTPAWVAAIPERVSVVEFSTMVIDAGGGPELCLGGVQESLPPQCSGPVAVGLGMNGWSESAQGIRWGERTVTVRWPPVDGRLEVVEDSEPETPFVDPPYSALPEECRNVPNGIGVEDLHAYAQSLGAANGGIFPTGTGDLVLQVVGDPEPHRSTLLASGGACVIEVPRGEAEQRRILTSVVSLLDDVPDVLWMSASTGPGGRIDIGVAEIPPVPRQHIRGISGSAGFPDQGIEAGPVHEIDMGKKGIEAFRPKGL